jgi:hypothetical protein
MAEKKIEPKRAGTDEPAAGARKAASKTSARRTLNKKVARVSARRTARRSY